MWVQSSCSSQERLEQALHHSLNLSVSFFFYSSVCRIVFWLRLVGPSSNALPHWNDTSERHVFYQGEALWNTQMSLACVIPICGNKMYNFVMKQVDSKRGMKYFMMCLWRKDSMSWWKLCPSVHCGFHPHAIHTCFRVFVAGEASPL